MGTKFFILFLLLLPCKDAQTNQDDFNWLLGDWIRVNEAEGLETFESWRKNSGKEYEGFGFTLKMNDTILKKRCFSSKIGGNGA
ncbi:hypothetical protein [Christiangramia portivictoriae]|uniref:hypothetical protein n=1 Tax=Christiangramia portivictoriae TaxID=326069 RepID=UPI0004091B10|nr:hypothetical protein [Christiangramia portivictoriae]